MKVTYERLDPTTLEASVSGLLYKKTIEANSSSYEAINEFKTILSVDKSAILANGVDSAIISATVYNHLDVLQNTYTGTLHFILKQGIVSAVCTNGVARISFASATPGIFDILVQGNDFEQNNVRVVCG